jgi:hypothetical protein
MISDHITETLAFARTRSIDAWMPAWMNAYLPTA